MKMGSNMCVELLKTFSKKEMKGLRYLVSCRHFNSDSSVIKLLDIINNSILNNQSLGDDMQKTVYKKIFAESVVGEKLNKSQKKHLSTKLSILTRLAERFLLTEALDEDVVCRSDLLYREMRKRRQFRLFNRHITKDKKLLDNLFKRDIKYHQHRYYIEKNTLDYFYTNGILSKEDNLKELVYELDMQYLLGRLELYVAMFSFQDLTKREYDSSAMEAMYDLLDLPEYAENPLIQIYRTIIDFMEHQSEAGYHKLLTLLDKHSSRIASKDLNNFYMVANNFCAQKIREGKFNHRELFELYKVVEEKNLLVEGGFISAKLKNAITAACRIGEFEWAKKMTEKYCQFIKKPTGDSVRHFNMGTIAFYQMDYRTALHHLIRVEPIDVNYTSACRLLMMKSHYENDKEYDERTLQIFRSTEKYFNDNKEFTSSNKKAHKNFIRTLIHVYRFRHRATKMKLENIKEKLKRQEVNIDKKWLMERIEELIDKRR